MNNSNVMDFVAHWAKEMLSSGAGVERVSLGTELLLKKYNFEEISTSILATKIDISAKSEAGTYSSRHLSVPTPRINLERLKRLNRLAYRVRKEENVDDKDLKPLLDEATNSKVYPWWANFGALELAMIALSRLFGGTWADILIVILNTAILFGLTFLARRIRLNRIITNVLSMFICTGSAALFYNIGFAPNFFVIILTNAFYLVPGIQLINAFKNILSGHEMNGIIEILKCFLEILTIIAGVGIAFFAFCQNSGLKIEGSIPVHSGIGNVLYEIEFVFLSILASLGFGISFEIRKWDLLFAAVGGGVTRVAFILLTYAIPTYRIAYMMLAAFVAALYAELLAIFQKKPSTLYLYPSVIPLIPGDIILYTCFGVIWQNPDLFGANFMESLLALVGICIGFVLCSTVTHYARKIKFIDLIKKK